MSSLKRVRAQESEVFYNITVTVLIIRKTMSLNRTLIYFTSSFEATFSKSKIMKRKFHRELISRNHADRKYGIVGVPFGKGQLKSGVGNAPEAIRAQKLLTDLHRMAYGGGLRQHPNLRTVFDQYYWFLSLGYDVKDYGDVTYPAVETAEKFDHNMKALEHIAACHKKARNSLSRVGGVLNNYTSVHLERKGETPLSGEFGLAGHSLVHDRPCGACPDVPLHVLPLFRCQKKCRT
uniref:Uncharacterized protein n=1 Tax=Timema monikensis TaxID=170555 RepID=A0A7R9EHQ7_9NEOP|nr:unnamed protein product [Timema monikensis]